MDIIQLRPEQLPPWDSHNFPYYQQYMRIPIFRGSPMSRSLPIWKQPPRSWLLKPTSYFRKKNSFSHLSALIRETHWCHYQTSCTLLSKKHPFSRSEEKKMSLYWSYTLRGLRWQKESLVVPFLSNVSLLSAANPPCATDVLVGSGVELKEGLEACLAFLWCGRCQEQNLLMLENSPIIDVTQWTPVPQWPPLGLLLQMSWFIFWLPGVCGFVRSSQKPGVYSWKPSFRVHRNYNHCSSHLLFFSLFNSFLVSEQTTFGLLPKNDGLHTSMA